MREQTFTKVEGCILMFLVALCMLSTGCSVTQQLSKDCGGDLEMGCKALFGSSETDDARLNQEINRNTEQDVLLAELKNRLSSAEASVNSLSSDLIVVSNQLNTLTAQAAAQGTTNTTQSNQIAALQAQQLTLQAQLLTMQTQANATQAQVTALALQDSIVDYLDCNGDGPGFDEVVLRTKSGKLVAYFEQGNQRFLSILVPGSYRSTDASSCPFTVNSNMKFCDGLGCR